MTLEKDPSEYLKEYAEKNGKNLYEKEIPYLLWNVEEIAMDVMVCLEQNKTLSEVFPNKYPMELGDPSMKL